MDIVARESAHVTGRTVPNGGAGDSSVLTAFGVFQGMRAAADHLWGNTSLAGKTVGIEGVGKVGHRLADHLCADGARVVIFDTNPAATARVLATHPDVEVAASRDELLASQLDVYSPCALGGAIDEHTVHSFGARIICGGANNQLAHPGMEKMLADCGIIYAPDYLVNSGGVIQVADELHGFNFERAKARAEQIFATTRQILAAADADGVPPAVAADRLAERRIAEVGRLRGIYLGS
jgi:valine dehydrogenase (NAD+)